MKAALVVMAALLVTGPSIPFFRYQRTVQVPGSTGQHYAVVEEAVWQHAKADLSDLRLYSVETETPYAMQVEWGSSQTEQGECRVLQPAKVEGRTQFLLDMSGVPEYDRVELRLAATNFVTRARVEGQDDPHGPRWAALGTTTLYELSKERLGHNATLQIPLTTFKYLRVTIERGIEPADVRSAIAGITRKQPAVWRGVGSRPTQIQQGRDTVVTFSVPEHVPIERLVFVTDPTQANFSRTVELEFGDGQRIGLGEISRIHMQRAGQNIDVEQLSLNFNALGRGILRAVVHNADDAPLRIADARLEQFERRIYFESSANTPHTLYYGDEMLGPPFYDYAKFFQKNNGADPISLGPEEANAAYAGRPDERPWSERHPAVLWLTIIVTVSTLTLLALKSLRVPPLRDS
jgi:Protein of unknown function (DUF3999)